MSNFNPEPYLEKLEALIDVDHVLAAEARQSAAWRFEPADRRKRALEFVPEPTDTIRAGATARAGRRESRVRSSA